MAKGKEQRAERGAGRGQRGNREGQRENREKMGRAEILRIMQSTLSEISLKSL
ncbi:MAG: hypothetical protein IJZ50_04675 [Alistipes sp.]|nr:hypothetical protein [Alistipes sp.]